MTPRLCTAGPTNNVPRSSESPFEAEVVDAAEDGSALLRLPLPCDEVDVGGPISPFSPDRRDDDRSDDDLSCNCFISKMVITDDEENNVQGEMQF